MKKKEFLEELDSILTQKSYPEKEDVLKDFEEHFRIGEEKGKSEEEIAKLLGNPKDIAEQFNIVEQESDTGEKVAIEEDKTANQQTRVENRGLAKLILILCLIFFNVVFVLGIVAGIFGALVAFFAAFIAVAVAGIVLLVVGILGLILGSIILPTYLIALAMLFGGIGTIALGILGAIATGWISVQCFKLLIRYCRWNLEVIRGGI